MKQSRSLRAATTLGRARLFILGLVALIAFSAPDAFAQQQDKVKANKAASFNVVPILIQSVTVIDGQLMATGLAGSTPFTTPVTMSPGALQEGGCPILNLTLGPIDLNLLGLIVQTSPICLDVTAVPGSGALLGNLLCAVANLLNPDGSNLSAVLAGLLPEQLSTLNSGLTQMLNQAVFIPITNSDALQAATCDVLNLALGPVDLNLLGLRVELDNCSNGPVTVDVKADPAGGLLGSLLCGLANLLNGGNPNTLVALLGQIAALISALLG